MTQKNWFRYLTGALTWRIRATFWYSGLIFRLWFAIGLDRDFDHSKEEDMQKMFSYPEPRAYRRFIGKPVETA